MGTRQEGEKKTQVKWQEDWARMARHEKIWKIKEKAGLNMNNHNLKITLNPPKLDHCHPKPKPQPGAKPSRCCRSTANASIPTTPPPNSPECQTSSMKGGDHTELLDDPSMKELSRVGDDQTEWQQACPLL